MNPTMTALTLADIEEALDGIVFRPSAGNEWPFAAAAAPDDPTTLVLSVTNQFARDSRGFDWESEYDEWTLLDGKSQTFTRRSSWPASMGELRTLVAELVAYAGAHEALEWLVDDDRIMLHNPHDDGDVSVTL